MENLTKLSTLSTLIPEPVNGILKKLAEVSKG